MLMRTDPFQDLDTVLASLLRSPSATARPASMPLDAWREGDAFANR